MATSLRYVRKGRYDDDAMRMMMLMLVMMMPKIMNMIMTDMMTVSDH